MSQNHPFPQLDAMLCFSVYSAGLAMNRLYRGLLDRFGLTYPQFLVLVALRQKGGQKVSELGEALFLESNTLTPLLKRMEQAGLVARRRAENDERVVRLFLTEAGARLTQELGCVPPQVLAASCMNMAEASDLTSKLNQLTASLRSNPPYFNPRSNRMKLLYTAHAKANGNGRNGISASDNGRVTFTLATPTEMGGSGKGTNPEEIFAAGYAACYLGAMRFVAGRDKLAMPAEATVSSSVSIGPRDDGQGFGIEVEMKVALPGMSAADADELTKRAHIVCPYSHAINGNVKVTTTVTA